MSEATSYSEIYSGGVAVTDDPGGLTLILRPEIRAVIWRREGGRDIDRAVRLFSKRDLSEIYNASGSDPEKLAQRGFDPDQMMIERHAQRHFPELGPVWADRLRVKETLSRTFHAPFHLNQMQVQPAQRHTVDHIAHQDRAAVQGRPQPKNLRLIATVAHSHGGTIFIPKEDAGRATPDVHNGRRFYHHPKNLRHAFQAGIHDVFITKTGGDEGGIHKAPYVRGGMRLLSFLISRHSYPEIRGQFDIAP